MTWSAGRKLIICAWTIIALSVVVGMSALWVAQNLGSRLDQAVNGSARQQMLAGQISTATSDLESLNRALAMAMMLQQTTSADEHRRQLASSMERMGQLVEEFRSLAADEESRRGIASLGGEYDACRSLQQQVQQKLAAQQMDEALTLMNGRLLPKLLEMNRTAKRLVSLQGQQWPSCGRARLRRVPGACGGWCCCRC